MTLRLGANVRSGVLAATLFITLASTASAQQWFAVAYTPVGALTPLLPDVGAGDGTRVGMLLRSGSMGWPAFGRKNTVTAGAFYATKKMRLTGEAGRMSISKCTDCVGYLGEVGAMIPVEPPKDPHEKAPLDSARELRIAVNPTLGFMKPTHSAAEEWTASFSTSLPLSVVVRVGKKGRLVPFVAPGFAYGRFNATGAAFTGWLVLFGGGVGLTDYIPHSEITAGFRKAFADKPLGTTVIGLGLVLGRR